jgi:NTP pyrophosphatase (non-canonical NTP hydrolase)
MEVKDLQNKIEEIITAIDDKMDVKHNHNETLMHLIEELGEVARHLGKPSIRKENINKEELADEIADVLMFMTRLATLHNIDLEESINAKINKLKQRHNL